MFFCDLNFETRHFFASVSFTTLTLFFLIPILAVSNYPLLALYELSPIVFLDVIYSVFCCCFYLFKEPPQFIDFRTWFFTKETIVFLKLASIIQIGFYSDDAEENWFCLYALLWFFLASLLVFYLNEHYAKDTSCFVAFVIALCFSLIMRIVVNLYFISSVLRIHDL